MQTQRRQSIYMAVGCGVPYTNASYHELLPDQWQLISIPLTDLDVENTIIFKVNWSELSGKSQPPFYLADVSLVSCFAEETALCR